MTVRVTQLERRAFFTPKTLALYLSVSERAVRSMLASGRIPSYTTTVARDRLSPGSFPPRSHLQSGSPDP
jgi:excisionase family DNA binding protein